MKKQKIQMLVVVILLVICVFAYIFISKNARETGFHRE